MLVRELILQNFKSFKERTVIPLAPITLLFGENSAGKSSVLQSLLLLKQTSLRAEAGRPLLLARGDLVDLGSIREMLYAHDPARVGEIGVLFHGKEFERSESFWPFAENVAGIGVRFGCRTDSPLDELVIHEIPVYWGEENRAFATLGTGRTEAAVERWSADYAHDPWTRYFNSGERFYTCEAVDPDHPGMLALYGEFFKYWNDLAKALQKWPNDDSTMAWQWPQIEDMESASGDDPYEFPLDGYLVSVIRRFSEQGRNLIAELLDRFDDYSYEQYVRDAIDRRNLSSRVRRSVFVN